MACCSSKVCLGMCNWTDCPGIETSTSLRQEDLVDFVAVNKAKNTVKKTRSDMNTGVTQSVNEGVWKIYPQQR